MPGLGDATGILGILGNLLAVPKTFEANRAQAELNNQLGAQLNQAFPPPQGQASVIPQQPVPSSFPGYHVPVLGGLERGIGTVGQVIQAALGQNPAAPRIPPQYFQTLTALRQLESQKALENYRAGQQEQGEKRLGQGEERLGLTEQHQQTQEELARQGLELRERSLEDREAHENAEKAQKMPTKLTLEGIAAGTVQDPRISPEQAKQWLDLDAKRDEDKRKATLADNLAGKPLPSPIQLSVGRSQAVVHMLDQLDALLKTPQGQQSAGMLRGRLGRLAYGMGASQNPVADQLTTLRERITAIGGGELMRGVSRAQQIYDRMIVHLPQAGDDPALLNEKIRVTRENLLDIAEELVKAATTPGAENLKSLQNLEKGPEPSPESGPPAAPTQGTTPSGNTFRVIP